MQQFTKKERLGRKKLDIKMGETEAAQREKKKAKRKYIMVKAQERNIQKKEET